MVKADYTRHIYKVDKALKTYTVYQLISVENGTTQLTEKLRIENYRGYSEATGIKDYLRLRDTGSWSSCEKVTGLRPYGKSEVFHGNRMKGKKSLLIFQFSIDRQTLIIDVFRAFYPFNKGILLQILKTHSYHL